MGWECFNEKYLFSNCHSLRKQWQEYEDTCQVNVDDKDGNYNAKHTPVWNPDGTKGISAVITITAVMRKVDK